MPETPPMSASSTLSFFASVIKSGEPWSDACQEAYIAAQKDFRRGPAMLAALVEAQRFLDYFTHDRTLFVGGGTPLAALKLVESVIANEGPPTPSPTGTELALESAKKALERIRDHPCTAYDHPLCNNEMYRGPYGIGIVDGHRAAAAIARDALSDTPT